MYDHHDRGPETYTARIDEYEAYYRWEFIGLLLDQEIQKRSGGTKSLADAFRWLYDKYANTGYRITPHDLEQAIGVATGVWLNDVFARYVYGQEKLPVYKYLAEYKPYFQEYNETFEQAHRREDYCGHTIPFFIDMALTASLAEHLQFGLHIGYTKEFGEHVLANNNLATLTVDDVANLLSEMTGENCSDFFTHWENSYERLTLESVVDWLRDYKAIGRSGSIDFRDAGTLSWDGELIAGQGKEIRIEVKDQDYLIQLGATPVTRFVVKFRTPSGQGEVIKGYPSFCWNTDQGFYEEVHIPLTRLEDCWVATVTIIPCSSIDHFMVMQTAWGGRAFFGAAVRVLPNSDD